MLCHIPSSAKPYWIAAACISGIGYKTLMVVAGWLEKSHYDWREWWEDKHIARESGLSAEQMTSMATFQKEWSIESLSEFLATSSIETLLPSDERFFPLLREIPDLPAIMFVQGVVPPTEYSLAVVGTRRMTTYGQMVTEELVKELILHYQVPIISGGMYGVDEAAHRAALHHKGKTVVVLGHGHAHPLNASLAKLYREVIEGGGAVVSEYPPWQPAIKGLFPARNRIVAGMSQGLLVTEAAERSGSHITAALAAEYGRDVFVTPGPISNPYSQGTVLLANQGAWLVTSALDIAVQMKWPRNFSHQSVCSPLHCTSEQDQLLRILAEMGPQSVSALSTQLNSDPLSTLRTLTQLQLRGIVSVRSSLWGMTRRVWHNDTLS